MLGALPLIPVSVHRLKPLYPLLRIGSAVGLSWRGQQAVRSRTFRPAAYLKADLLARPANDDFKALSVLIRCVVHRRIHTIRSRERRCSFPLPPRSTNDRYVPYVYETCALEDISGTSAAFITCERLVKLGIHCTLCDVQLRVWKGCFSVDRQR